MYCKLCGYKEQQKKYQIDRFQKPFIIFECPECGFQFQDIDPESAYSFYDEGYYTGKNDFSYTDERQNENASRIVWQARMKKLIKQEKTEESPKRFLDVGCSFGGFMQVASEMGYDPSGIEVSDYAAEYARKRFGKQKIYSGSIEDMVLPENYFSIISLIEVIEHLYQPDKALQNLYRALQPGGVILIQTADMAGLQAKRLGPEYHYYLPGHLSYFNRFNLKQVMEKSGFHKTKFVGGVEFGLLPKLKKSRYSFKKLSEYLKWFRISWYHYISKIVIGRLHLTSSMVMLGWK